MAFCRECGAQVPESSVFCGKCGAAQRSAYAQVPPEQLTDVYDSAPRVSEQTQPAYEAPAYERPHDEPQAAPVAASSPQYAEQRPPKGSPYAVVGSWKFFWSGVLLGLPVIGWVFTIVWACGGVHNYNLQRMARAFIIGWIATILISVATWLIGGFSLAAIAELIQSL